MKQTKKSLMEELELFKKDYDSLKKQVDEFNLLKVKTGESKKYQSDYFNLKLKDKKKICVLCDNMEIRYSSWGTHIRQKNHREKAGLDSAYAFCQLCKKSYNYSSKIHEGSKGHIKNLTKKDMVIDLKPENLILIIDKDE